MKRFTYIDIILSIFLILSHLLLSTASAETSQTSKSNIIFIMADDLGKNILSLHNAKSQIKMPNLERLAKQGVIFNNAYATHKCMPTRAKLVSGRYGVNTGVTGNIFGEPYISSGRITGFYRFFYKGDKKKQVYSYLSPRYVPSFALSLKQAGYTTAIAGKWHLGNYFQYPRIFRTFGFDQWLITILSPDTAAYTDKGITEISKFPPEKIADFVINFITQNKDKPFFVYYPMHLIHRPIIATPLNPNATTQNEKLVSMVQYVDFIIGRLMKTLEALNLKENTIIFFSGDNGSLKVVNKLVSKNAHKDKGTLYEGGINVPLIVSGGAVINRGETEALVDFTDILPTLADFAGVSVIRKNRENENDYSGIDEQYVSVAGQYKGDGYSLVPFLTGAAEDTAREWIMSVGSETTVIRDQRFKLWANKELYDLYHDPREKNNLYDSDKPLLIAAKQRLENILNSMPKPTKIDTQFEPVDWDYGMLTHWSMDHPKSPMDMTVLSDDVGGYDAQGKTEITFRESVGDFQPSLSGYDAQGKTEITFRQGKFGEAITAEYLYAPYSKRLFYHLSSIDNNKLFPHLEQMVNDKKKGYLLNLPDKEKSFSAMTLSAWVQAQKIPEQNIYLLKQPYIGKQGNLMSFAISEDATVKFELTVDDKTRRLESKAIDEQLWEKWMHIVASWDGRDDCGKAVLYVNGESVAQACLGKPLSANDTDNLLLGGFAEKPPAADGFLTALRDNTIALFRRISQYVFKRKTMLVDDIAIWRQPLMPMQIAALYELGNRFSYNASEVDSLFNTPEEDGITKIGDDVWQRTALKDTPDADRLIIHRLADAVEIQFGEVMAIRSEMDR